MRRVALALVAAVLAVSCAGGGRVVVLPKSQLPADLYRAASQAQPRTTTLLVFMVQGNRLAPVSRTGRSALPLPNLVMRELLAGPTREEFANGLTTDIPETTKLRTITIDPERRIASVDLSQDFETYAERDVVLLRFAQVVWTLTELPDVDAVRFLIEGEPIQVLDQDIQLISAPVARGHYSQFAPTTPEVPVSRAPLA